MVKSIQMVKSIKLVKSIKPIKPTQMIVQIIVQTSHVNMMIDHINAYMRGLSFRIGKTL